MAMNMENAHDASAAGFSCETRNEVPAMWFPVRGDFPRPSNTGRALRTAGSLADRTDLEQINKVSTGAGQERIFKRQWYERFPRIMPVGIFLLTSAVTLVSVAAIESTETRRRATQLTQTAKVLASALARGADTHEAYLRSGAAVFATQQVVSGPQLAAAEAGFGS